ncbi:hypothetical protein MKW92_024822 [Papaver armeniacum]|nr:hypothetical protein MKW92_024822 [Papaver armeniacum]
MEGKDMERTRCDKIGSSRQDCCADMGLIQLKRFNLGEVISSNLDYGFWLVGMHASIGVASAVGDFGCPPFHAIKNNNLY